ncbi:MAG TPA: carnitine dehydratase [Chloroflexi bacterium]|jgi:crotonobetainyl-CoA:carnitine CoA-transferase CaiB-like acyl-CoA transferase|nr:carnitine dehydratase [Chloroflexota bacterium]
MGILTGITVIELCEVYQGPLAGQSLGDFGARVIKVERPPTGDPMRGEHYAVERNLMSSYFAATNRNKESICLDLKSEEGRSALHALLRTADVLLHNYRAGVMERLGFGYEALAEINPRLIYAGASGYGDSGPLAGLAGQDLLIQSITGIARKGTNSGATPNYLNVPLTDYASGMLLVQGVLLALIERMSSGRGQKVSISLFDTAVSMQSLEAASLLNYGYETRWFDLSLNFAMQVADGWVTVLGFFRQNPLQLICQALDLPDLSELMGLPTDVDQAANREEIVERLRPAFHLLTMDEAVHRLQEVGVLSAPVLSYEQVLEHPQVTHNGMIRKVPAEGQEDLRVIDHPLRLSRTPHSIRRGPPLLGEHTAEVLGGLGFDAAAIAQASSGRPEPQQLAGQSPAGDV